MLNTKQQKKQLEHNNFSKFSQHAFTCANDAYSMIAYLPKRELTCYNLRNGFYTEVVAHRRDIHRGTMNN